MSEIENLKKENATLKKSFEAAVKFASTSCDRCPYDSKVECTRPHEFKTQACDIAVKNYFQNAGKI